MGRLRNNLKIHPTQKLSLDFEVILLPKLLTRYFYFLPHIIMHQPIRTPVHSQFFQ